MGFVSIVVNKAITTNIVKSVGEKAPTLYAMFRTTSSTSPLVFSNAPSATDVFQFCLDQRAARMAPPILPPRSRYQDDACPQPCRRGGKQVESSAKAGERKK